MGYGFLQGFYDGEILVESQDTDVGDQGYRQALHLAMLGLGDEAHAIFTLLHAHDLPLPDNWAEGTATTLFYHASVLVPPNWGDVTADVAALQFTSMKCIVDYYLSEEYDLEKVTEDGYEKLQGVSEGLGDKELADAESGYAAIELSAALTTLLYMADKLGKDKDVWELLGAISKRIHADKQAEFFHSALVAWEKWLVPGLLREAMGLELSKLRDYAYFVQATLKKRLDNGPVRLEEVYAGFSVRNLLEELDRNTMDDPEFDPNDFWLEEDNIPTTIFKAPASKESIEAKEEEMGRKIPEELKELLMVSDGCHMVKTAPGMRETRFVPVKDIFVENEEYMDDYGFTMLPDFEVEPM
ncbi:SMI1/KNR4 family protein, partial [Candidatus Bathyarchaeota archaeon]|nr:SMI1/KNR4 family protein [Candidatus Bathyarchaeota archaeon]